MDSKKAKIMLGKSPLSLLNEKLARSGTIAKWELVSDFTKKTTIVPNFTFKVTIGDNEVFGSDVCKKKAKQNAAHNMLMQISDDISLLQTLQTTSQSTEENFQNHIGNLSMFCSRNDLPPPQYSENIESGPAHLRTFSWNCMVGKHREVGVAHSTKAAKQLAAQAMYLKLVREVSEPNDVHLPDYGLGTDFVPFKIEKSEKLEPKENDEMEISENEDREPISPEPYDYEERERDVHPRHHYDYRRREHRRSRSREHRRRVDRRYEEYEEYERTDRHSTSRYSSRDRSHNSERSRSIRIAKEEVLDKKYKIQLSSFTDWIIPNASETPSVIDEASGSTVNEQDQCDVKREMKYSDSIRNSRVEEHSSRHQVWDEFNCSVRDEESIAPAPASSSDPRDLEDDGETGESKVEEQFEMREPEIDVTDYEIKPELKFKIKLVGLTTSESTIADAVSTVSTIVSSPVSNDQETSNSTSAAIIPEIELQTDDKIGLKVLNTHSLRESEAENNETFDKYRIDRIEVTHSPKKSTCAASVSNQIPNESECHQHTDSLPEYSMKLEMAHLSFKAEAIDMGAIETINYEQPTTSVEPQVLPDNIEEFAQADKDCSNGHFPTEAEKKVYPKELSTDIKKIYLKKFDENCGEFSSGNDSSSRGTFNTADVRLETERTSNTADLNLETEIPMDISEDESTNENSFTYMSEPETPRDCKIESKGDKAIEKQEKSSANTLKQDDNKPKIDEKKLPFSNDKMKIINKNSETSEANNLREISNGNVWLKSEHSKATGKDEETNGNYLNDEDSLGENSNRSVTSVDPEEPIIGVKPPLELKISDYYYMMLNEHGINLKPKVCKKICELIDALAKWDVLSNPHIVEEGIAILEDIIVLIDLHLNRVAYQVHDGEYIVVIQINSMSKIVEMTKHKDLNEATRSVFFKVIDRLDRMLR